MTASSIGALSSAALLRRCVTSAVEGMLAIAFATLSRNRPSLDENMLPVVGPVVGLADGLGVNVEYITFTEGW